MQRKSIPSRAFWIIIIGGMVTGMGNGSVFGAAMMCFLGRGRFADWGGWWPLDYNPHTFTGFYRLVHDRVWISLCGAAGDRSQAPRYGRKNGLSVPGSTGAINRTNFGANSYA